MHHLALRRGVGEEAVGKHVRGRSGERTPAASQPPQGSGQMRTCPTGASKMPPGRAGSHRARLRSSRACPRSLPTARARRRAPRRRAGARAPWRAPRQRAQRLDRRPEAGATARAPPPLSAPAMLAAEGSGATRHGMWAFSGSPAAICSSSSHNPCSSSRHSKSSLISLFVPPLLNTPLAPLHTPERGRRRRRRRHRRVGSRGSAMRARGRRGGGGQ